MSPVPPSEIKVMGDLCMLNGQTVVFVCAYTKLGGQLRVLLADGSNCRDVDPESTSFIIHNRASTIDTCKNFKCTLKAWFVFK